MNSEIFNGLGKLTEEHHMHINKNATPVIHPSRKMRQTRKRIGYFGKKQCNKKNQRAYRLG